MAASEEALLAYWKEHREQLRQSETQRAVLTNFLLVVTAALSALIVQQKFANPTIPLCIFIVLLGIYGTVTVSKYYERATYHLSQARALTRTLAEMGSLEAEGGYLDAYRDAHYRNFPRLHKVRLHYLWRALHIVIILYGITLLVIATLTAG